ncbi:hypothetical protein B0T18DRAFT_482150 [Schizothecium vesticola]|uniref:NAD(P)-binding protein n=1 Tax=Schizothecium vesticola TaxID=314040 RepID=A0AA40EIU8_9PEZI|nr:hypothetical protein B0T18DRAFT_482150 [Schizothecium vesticola]
MKGPKTCSPFPGQFLCRPQDDELDTSASPVFCDVTKVGTSQFSLEECPDLSGKVAVITSGSQGIGFGVAHTLLKNSIAKVYIISTTKDAFDGARRTCDLSDWRRTKQVAETIRHDTDRLDILVNNSGRGVMAPALTDYGVDRHMAINHFGHAVLTSNLLPLLKQTAEQGNVPKDTQFVSLGEINRYAGPNGQYGRSKLASLLYTRYFDRNVTQNGHPNMLMNATHPGFVRTKRSTKDIHEPYSIAGYAMSHVVDPFKKDQVEGAVPTLFAVTMADAGGQYLCPPATPESASELAQSDELMENLMNLNEKMWSAERRGGEAVVAI